MIQVIQLRKSFDQQVVLKGIDLEIRDNQTLVILGPSGQGKTVLIKTIVRLLESDSGEVHFDGVNILALKRKEFYEFQKQTAFVFQNSALFDFLSVRENLSLFLKMHTSLNKTDIQREIVDALSFVSLDQDILDKFPEDLSGGMRKRVAIARAMIKKPRYIFFDEPTTGLDRGNAEKVTELILMLQKKTSATSLVVTHDIKLMRDISDQVALLKEGKVFFLGSKELISNDMLRYLYDAGERNGL